MIGRIGEEIQRQRDRRTSAIGTLGYGIRLEIPWERGPGLSQLQKRGSFKRGPFRYLPNVRFNARFQKANRFRRLSAVLE